MHIEFLNEQKTICLVTRFSWWRLRRVQATLWRHDKCSAMRDGFGPYLIAWCFYQPRGSELDGTYHQDDKEAVSSWWYRSKAIEDYRQTGRDDGNGDWQLVKANRRIKLAQLTRLTEEAGGYDDDDLLPEAKP